jgi:hypothetical protein
MRFAAWAGLQDSTPRSALLSLHARVDHVTADALADPSLVQLWGPRYVAHVVAERDRAVFTLGRMPDSAARRGEAEQLAERIERFLDGRAMTYESVGRALGIHPSGLRYAAPTGRVVMRWDGAERPTIWTAPAPVMSIAEARSELVRRHLHILGPATPESFAEWAGVTSRHARATFDALRGSTTDVRTHIGDAVILTDDEDILRDPHRAPAPARLLPSGDPYLLLWGADRELLIPEAARRHELWPTRVWPGAVMVDGDVVGTWRRAAAAVTINAWRRLSQAARDAVEAEARSFPLPDVSDEIRIRWN